MGGKVKTFSLHWGSGIVEEEAQIGTEYHVPTIQLLKFILMERLRGLMRYDFVIIITRVVFSDPLSLLMKKIFLSLERP